MIDYKDYTKRYRKRNDTALVIAIIIMLLVVGRFIYIPGLNSNSQYIPISTTTSEDKKHKYPSGLDSNGNIIYLEMTREERKKYNDEQFSLDKLHERSENITRLSQEIVDDIRDVSKQFDKMMDQSIKIRLMLEEDGVDTSGLIESEQNIQKHMDNMDYWNEETQKAINKNKN